MLQLRLNRNCRPFHGPRHYLAVLTALATLGLVGLGGLVTSHGVGMAVPDWPNTYGYNMFFFPISQWVGGVFYEHTHRLLASGVGLLTTILALWLQGNRSCAWLRWGGLALLALAIVVGSMAPSRWADGIVLGVVGALSMGASYFWPKCPPAARWLRWLGVAAFLAVVLQGVLGGLRVVLFKDQIGIFHATLAQLFFVLVCAIALFTSRWWQEGRGQARGGAAAPREIVRRPGWLAGLFVASCALILIQLTLGATMRHQHAGLSIPDFPLAYGELWPAMDAASVAQYNQQRLEVMAVNPITGFQVGLQMVHRLMALLILAAVAASAWMARRQLGPRHPASKLALGWLGLILTQVLLGAATIWSNKAADIATAHVLVGALSLALGAMATLVLFRDDSLARRASLSPNPRPTASTVPFGARPSTAI